MAKCLEGLAKSCDILFIRKRRMHPLNCSYFDVNSTENDSILSKMPPTYIVFDALIRRGIFKASSSTEFAFPSLCMRMVRLLLTHFNVILCHCPSFSLRDIIVSMRFRPRAIALSCPLRRINAKKCLCFSFAPYKKMYQTKLQR